MSRDMTNISTGEAAMANWKADLLNRPNAESAPVSI